MFNRDFDEIFYLDSDGNVAYCTHYDPHERTAFGTCGGPAISPPEIDYRALTAEGIILVPPAQIAVYQDMGGEEWVETMIEDLETAVEGEVLQFEATGDRDDKLDIKYMGQMYGFAFFWFDLDICSDEVCGRRAAEYESINRR